jgi:hypothetical protein
MGYVSALTSVWIIALDLARVGAIAAVSSKR